MNKSLYMGVTGVLASAISFIGGYYVDKTDSEDFHHEVKEYRTTEIENKTIIVLHHFAADITAEQAAAFHINGHNWAGLGYHYAIEKDGTIKQAHYPNVVSYHTAGNNTHTIGIAIAGDKTKEEITPEQYNSLVILLQSLKLTLPNIEFLEPHSKFKATDCPSDNIRKLIPELRKIVND